MIIRILGFVFLTGGLLGCIKKGESPPTKIPKEFPSQTIAYKPINELPYLAWWQQFHDQELNRLMKLGLKNNPDIDIALGNLEQSKGVLQYIKLSWVPTIKLIGGYSTNPALGNPGGFYAVWPYYAINLAQQYFQQKKTTYSVLSQQAALQAVRLTTVGQIAASYFTLIGQQEQLRLLHQLNKDLQLLIQLAQQDIDIGLANTIDLAQLQSDQQLIQAQTKPIIHNITASQNALRFLINDNPGPIKSGQHFTQLDFRQFKPGSLPAEVLNNRPDMKMAQYELMAAKVNISLAYSNLFPVLQLDDFLGKIHLPANQFAQATDAYGTANLSFNTVGAAAASQGGYHVALAMLNKTVRRIVKEVDTSYSANKERNEQFALLLHAQKTYEKKYLLQQGLFKSGLISYKELLQSKIYLDNLALSVNQAKLELAMSLVQLYQDLAGGYAYQDKVAR